VVRAFSGSVHLPLSPKEMDNGARDGIRQDADRLGLNLRNKLMSISLKSFMEVKRGSDYQSHRLNLN